MSTSLLITGLNAKYRSMQGLKGRPPTFKYASFETEIGGSRLNFSSFRFMSRLNFFTLVH